MANEPMPTALLGLRVPSDPCFAGRGKSAGVVLDPLRGASDVNIEGLAAPV